MTRKELILASISDLVMDLMYYDRKEDEDLPKGEIEKSMEEGEISVDEMTDQFTTKLYEFLQNSKP